MIRSKPDAPDDSAEPESNQPPNVIDAFVEEHGDWALFMEMKEFFGVRRMTDLIGWAVIWGLMGVESVNEMRKKLEAQGLSESATYRAARDFQRFREHVEQKRNRPVSLKQIVQEISTLKLSSK